MSVICFAALAYANIILGNVVELFTHKFNLDDPPSGHQSDQEENRPGRGDLQRYKDIGEAVEKSKNFVLRYLPMRYGLLDNQTPYAPVCRSYRYKCRVCQEPVSQSGVFHPSCLNENRNSLCTAGSRYCNTLKRRQCGGRPLTMQQQTVRFSEKIPISVYVGDRTAVDRKSIEEGKVVINGAVMTYEDELFAIAMSKKHCCTRSDCVTSKLSTVKSNRAVSRTSHGIKRKRCA
ncbi:uncharacterized protein V2V93DRAFT_363650 [Kockiozyma suomiensis]|uniref:uncharacterized protein n=1 Tax=Kockiozyma suomiensis TaxID=1337062 RepID=UPI0033441079